MRRLSSLLALLALAAAGCEAHPPPPMPDAGTPDAGPIAEAPPTWHQDVAPLVAAHCSGCHVAGGIAPFDLTVPEEAQAYAQGMAVAVQAGTMPPFLPGGDTPPLLHERKLTPAEVDTFVAWAAAGAPLGDASKPAELPVPEVVDIGTPEVSVDIGYDYVPDASLTDDYRCFLVDLGLTTSRKATGYRITPTNRSTVHHVIVSLFAPADREKLAALDGQDGRDGWQCFSGPVPESAGVNATGMLGAWVPGLDAIELPEGTGVKLEPGQLAVVQVHYNLEAEGSDRPDRTKMELALASTGREWALQNLLTLPLANFGIHLPAGETGITETKAATADAWSGGLFSAYVPDKEVFALGVAAHMHTLGTRIQLVRSRSGEEDVTLLEIPRWDFHWQDSWWFQQPISLKIGDVLTLRCGYDNSVAARRAAGFPEGPPTDIFWGEGTRDEMCLAYLQVTDNKPQTFP